MLLRAPRILTLATVLLGLVSACYSTSLLQEPEPLMPGRVRFAAGVIGNTTGAGPEVGLRVGLPKDMEVRAKLSLSTVEAGLNVRAYDGEVIDLFLMPGYSAALFYEEDVDPFFDESARLSERRLQALVMPAIAKFEVTPRFDVFVGPDLRVGTRDAQGWFGAGGHLGMVFSEPTDHMSLVPECSLLRGVLGASAAPPDEDGDGRSKRLTPGDWQATCGLGVTLGGRHAGQVE